MSNANEMISFLYPSLIGEGDKANVVPSPDLVVDGVELGKSYPFIVTAGFVFDDSKEYVTSLDIFYDGVSVLDKEHQDDNQMDTLMFSKAVPGQTIVMSSMFLGGVRLDKSGVYNVVLELHEGNDVRSLIRQVDKKECFFIVPPVKG
ncbi:hypothetical protein [Serratia sp. 201]|uniref:hypothetical protein n=1 Tax=Serratia sp. 201 TaxID=3096764 RepID=UPI00300846A4